MANIYKKNTGELPYRQSRLRVIIADDHTILRQGLRSILDADPDLEVIGEASSVQDALALARCLRPDVVISDVSFENGSGIRTISQLRRECAGVRVIMLTGHDSEECERAAMQAGAHAYILKDSPVEVLLRAIYSASAGVDAAIPPRELPNRRVERPAAIIDMTARERQVLIGVALGYSSKRIAGQLGRSVKTIEKHRFKMMHKLGLHNAAAVTRYAMDNGLLEDRGEPRSRTPRIDFPEP
jgi:DNA-binding NarL/FixJ family response regulator